jgi:hypothetical protein
VTLSEVGRSGQAVDVLHGGDVNPDGRLLSVAELQRAFRSLQERQVAGQVPTDRAVGIGYEQPREADAPAAPDPMADTPDHGSETDRIWGEPAAAPHDRDRRPGTGVQIDERWVAVIAAHAGAGASTVALAIADAAAAAGQTTHLIETAHPSRSGLVAAATAELGTDETGAWRRGVRRGLAEITIDRRAGEHPPVSWPLHGAASHAGLVVIDLGLPSALDDLRSSGARIALVFRPTVPGVRLVEQVLTALGDQRAVVAAVGPGRWPGPVTASQGPRLRALRAANAVVTVPWDRHLEVTGATNSPLPKPVTAAGRALLGLINAARPGDAIATSAPKAAPRRKGITR